MGQKFVVRHFSKIRILLFITLSVGENIAFFSPLTEYGLQVLIYSRVLTTYNASDFPMKITYFPMDIVNIKCGAFYSIFFLSDNSLWCAGLRSIPVKLLYKANDVHISCTYSGFYVLKGTSML